MILNNLIIIRRSSKRLICRIIIEALVQSNTFFSIGTALLTALPMITSYIIIRVKLSAKLTKTIKILQQKRSKSAINGANNKVKKLSLGLFALIITPT